MSTAEEVCVCGHRQSQHEFSRYDCDVCGQCMFTPRHLSAVGTKDGADEIEVPCLSCNDDPNVDCPVGCGRR